MRNKPKSGSTASLSVIVSLLLDQFRVPSHDHPHVHSVKVSAPKIVARLRTANVEPLVSSKTLCKFI